MAQCLDKRNRLRRDGTSQDGRRLVALDPASVRLDEREVEDFLVFARRFARRVVYHDLTDQDAGDWEAFFACSPTVVLASLRLHNPLPTREAVQRLLAAPPKPTVLADFFQQLLALARRVDGWRRQTGTATDFGAQVAQRVRANLGTLLGRLVAYEKAADARFDAVHYRRADYAGFSEAWSLADPDAVPPDGSLFGDATTTAQQVEAARQRLFQLFVPLYNVALELIGLAPAYFKADLEGRRDHAPHLALFIAFLRLYLLLRDDANKLTQRHLDFFYRVVLGLEAKPPRPDHVHVVALLARQVAEHRLPAGTLLDAGKGPTGVPRRYALDADLVANTAQIAHLRTLFVATARDADRQAFVRGVHAAPVAPSQDGLGAPLEDTEKPSWPTLGAATMPPATLGFVVAARTLLLAEGTRTITLDLKGEGLPAGLDAVALATAFAVRLSGEKGWIVPTPAQVAVTRPAAGTLRLAVTLASTDPAVTAADTKALGADYGTTEPLLEVTLTPPTAAVVPPQPHPYDPLKAFVLHRLVLTVDVAGVTEVIVQNEATVLDAGKPFEPFGFAPRAGAHGYVGSREAFQKKLTALRLHLTWDGLPQTFAAHYAGYDVAQGTPATSAFTATAAVLQDGGMLPLGTVSLFTEAGGTLQPTHTIAFTEAALSAQRARSLPTLGPRTPATQHGFARLTLGPQAFYHAAQTAVVTRQALAAARLPQQTVGARYRQADGSLFVGTSNTAAVPAGAQVLLPQAPYTPTVKAFSVSYTAVADTEDATTTTPDTGGLTFFHLEPFGHRRRAIPTDAAVASAAAEGRTDVQKPTLLPRLDDEGTLYVGIKDLEPLQSLSVLFQVAESTADAGVPTPTVRWSYLTADRWRAFEDYEITVDTTRGLLTSGLLTFVIPAAISAANPRMTPGLHWIKAAVADGARGVSELIAVHTQAARATFVGSGKKGLKDPDHLKAPLPAKAVKGLVVNDAQVAAVTQPYDGFGGRPAEAGMAYYTRVAEQLRHKGRAITLFDYERLVLERFPGIYKVKCINHTDDRHETAPGHVLIAVVPDFSLLKAVDRRAPQVTLAVLDAIRTYLETVNSPFVHTDAYLHVRNPVYEAVRVAFKVRFHAHVSAPVFHRRRLNDALNRFLSPWAYEDRAEIVFGGTVYKSTLLNFVEEQDYVDYVTDFRMTHRDREEDVDAIEAATPRSILVPAATHGIEVLAAPDCPVTQPLHPSGLGQMTLRRDFTVPPSPNPAPP